MCSENVILLDMTKPPSTTSTISAKEPKVFATTISLPHAARSLNRPEAIWLTSENRKNCLNILWAKDLFGYFDIFG